MSRTLIAGCGFVGHAVARRLLQRNQEVIALSRTLSQIPPGARGFAADLRDAKTLHNLPDGLTHVVYCAGADAHTEQAYIDIYLSGLNNLLEQLHSRSSQPRFLFTSSTAVYEQTSGEWVDETTVVAPERFPGAIMLKAEGMVRQWLPESLIVRAAGIYGDGRESLIQSVRSGTATFAPAGPWYTNRIHREDCAAAMVHLLLADDAHGLYIACDDEPADRRSMLEWLASRLGAAPPRETASLGTVRGGNKRCRNIRLKASGFQLCFPSFRDGYAPLIGPAVHRESISG